VYTFIRNSSKRKENDEFYNRGYDTSECRVKLINRHRRERRAGLLLQETENLLPIRFVLWDFNFICGQRFFFFIFSYGTIFIGPWTLKYYLDPKDDDTHSVEFCQSPASVSSGTK